MADKISVHPFWVFGFRINRVALTSKPNDGAVRKDSHKLVDPVSSLVKFYNRHSYVHFLERNSDRNVNQKDQDDYVKNKIACYERERRVPYCVVFKYHI